MKKNLGPKTYFYPMPVLIIATYDKDGKANAMNAAWGGVNDTNQIHLCLSTDHKTTQNIILKKEFTISFADKAHAAESDYFGIASGNKGTDKLAKVGFHVNKAPNVDAPLIEEYPLSLECKVHSLINDDNGTTFIVADIVNVIADDSVMKPDGKIDTEKAEFISYDASNNAYNVLGGKVANAFKDGKKFF